MAVGFGLIRPVSRVTCYPKMGYLGRNPMNPRDVWMALVLSDTYGAMVADLWASRRGLGVRTRTATQQLVV